MSDNHALQLRLLCAARQLIGEAVELGCNLPCPCCMGTDGAWDTVDNVRRLLVDALPVCPDCAGMRFDGEHKRGTRQHP